MLIDLRKIRRNTGSIVDLCQSFDIDVFGVTKATCGDRKIAEAMIAGGARGIADSRIENIKKLQEADLGVPLMLLRTPMLSETTEVVEHADISLNTEIKVLDKLSKDAKKAGRVHKVLLMVEMGDLREGMTTDQIQDAVEKVVESQSLDLYGIGMNLACFGGVVPTEEKIKKFSDIVEKLEKRNNMEINVVSGGNSANIPSLLNDVEQRRINNLRLGESILLGLETVNRSPIPNTFQDAFKAEAEIIELKKKPSVPEGEISQNAFGETPSFKDRGEVLRVVVALGKQDVIVEDLKPLDSNLEILGSSSDHIILHSKKTGLNVGDKVGFMMKYGALVHLYTSPYVNKQYVER
ncbi:MAG: alanine/ornithine racemase family PLP-dependent enzyme [Candidatus Thermoplasmatota archaeon]